MLNILWPLFIIISIIYGILFGNIENINNAVYDGAQSTITTMLTLLGSICLWNGIMNIAMKTSFINSIEKIIRPIINFLFPELKEKQKIKKEISMNIIANILGLGNAATPLGIKAINSMQKENPNKKELSDSMIMLIVINTASIQIIPTTIIAIRNSLGSANSTKIIVPVWITTIITAIVGVILTKLFIKISKIKRANNNK